MIQKRERRKIHTSVKLLAYINALPDEYAASLHPSMLSRYKNHFNAREYFGRELAEIELQNLEQLRQINLYETDRKMVAACLEITHVVREAFTKAKRYLSTLREHSERIVEVLQRLRDVLPVKKASALLNIDESTLRNWIREVRVRCADSLINHCRKLHPNQLLKTDTDRMKKLLISERFRFWSLRSLYFYALREKLVSIGLSTWYKYVRLLNVKRQKPISLKHYGKSVRAAQPNEYWHADVMYYRTADGSTSYLYTVMDNYSRFPLVARVSTELSGKTRRDTIREALQEALNVHPNVETIKLVLDGGSENFNGTVTEFLASLKNIEIKRIRALTDVPFSNSMVEALNKIFRCDYINHLSTKDHAEFEKAVDFTRNDYSFNRPHGASNGLTPFEMYAGIIRPEEISWKDQISKAGIFRREANKLLNCPTCSWT